VHSGLRLNALSLKLAAVASVLNAFALRRIGVAGAAAWSAAAIVVSAWLLARLRRRPHPFRRHPSFLALGLLDGVGGICLFASLERLGPVPVALLGALAPAFAAPLAFLILGERPSRAQVALGASAVGGALLFSWQGGALPSGAGLAFAGASTLAYAAGNLVAKLALRRFDACTVLGSSRLASLAVVLGWGLATGGLAREPVDALGVGLVVAASVLGGFLAVLLFYRALRHASLTVTTLVRTTGPVAAAACAWPFFPVVLTPLNLVGGAVLLGSVAWLGAGAARPSPSGAAAAPSALSERPGPPALAA
jgi:probable blue pigment (indigoidine) exporter